MIVWGISVAVLLGELIFIIPGLWAQGTTTNNPGSISIQPAGKTVLSEVASIYVGVARCMRLDPVLAEDAETVPPGERRVVGPGAPPASVQTSSALDTADASRLFEADPGTYWHIDLMKHLYTEWFVISLKDQRQARVNYIRAVPRSDSPVQMFTTACLEGSDDGKEWRVIARLRLLEDQKTAGWVGWRVPPLQSYRYFKLLIPNGRPEQNHTFYSIGKLELYQ